MRTEELRRAVEIHVEQVSDLILSLSSELRTQLRPAIDNSLSFFHANDWKEPWLIGLISFHCLLLITVVLSRRCLNFQMCLFLLSLAGVYLAESLNKFLGYRWKSFATQNYFDPHGIFLSTLWSGPLLVISIIILVNTLFSLCHLIVRWKRAELRHQARLTQKKQE